MATATKTKTNNVKTSLRPLDNRVVVRRADTVDVTTGGIALPDNAKKKTNRGFVEAVGDGKMLDNGTRCSMQVGIGDQVLFNEYSGDEINVGEDDLLIIREGDILAIIG